MMRILTFPAACLLLGAGIAAAHAADFGPELLISVKDQELGVYEQGKLLGKYPVSTSRFGIGDEPSSYKTPLGTLWVYDRIGGKLPEGEVIKNRLPTGEILAPNAKDRDPIVTRIIWLKGLFGDTGHSFERCIYIHGTPEERTLGHPASYGCIRMRSADVVKVYDETEIGTHVLIENEPLKKMVKEERVEEGIPEPRFWLWRWLRL